MNQEQALAILKSGRNTFLTGSAGTGKTHVLNQYIHYLKERKVPVAVTASTGIAATHMNGMTIHAWSGIGVKDQLTRGQLLTLSSKKYLSKHLESVKVLIIDEISMLHQKQLELVNQVLCHFKNNNLPFGGIQLVLCGDFFQLPPVGRQGERSKEKFAFMSPCWVKAELNVCYLTEQYRQSDNLLNEILNEIRKQTLSENSLFHLKKSASNELSTDKSITKLFTHNVDVDAINLEHLAQLKGSPKKFKASTKGNEKLVELLSNSVLAPNEMELKIESKVMFVKNNLEKNYVNGTMGIVKEFTSKGFPLVETQDGKRIIAEPEVWEIQEEFGKSLASFTQIPLRLAWAITIHKSQGMTLDEAEIDLSKTFETGQGYVALSRLKNLENMKLHGFNEQALAVDPLAFKADLRFQELSSENENKYHLKDLNLEAKKFIIACDGLVSAKEIAKQKAKLKEKKRIKKSAPEKKLSTYEISYELMKQNTPLEKIAEIRGMTIGTIAGHMIRVKQDHPEVNFSYYKPKSSIVKKVEEVYEKMDKSNEISLKFIHSKLQGKVSFEDIKLSLAFLA